MARAFALAVTIALHLGVLLMLTGHWRSLVPERTARATAPEPREPEPADPLTVRTVVDWTRAPDASPAPPRAAASEDVRVVVDLEQARAAGREHAQRHFESIQRLRRRQFGDAIFALVEAPPAQGWPALEQLVREGDRAAADALAELAARCEEDASRAAGYARLADEAARGLDPVAAAFVRAAMDQELALLQRESAACRAGGFGMARLEKLLRERGIEPRRGNGGEWDVWRQFREAFDAESGPVFSGPFAPVLETFGQQPISTDEWITLFAAAEDDRAVAYALGFCLPDKCGGMPELPPAEHAGLLRLSAEAGNVHSARALAEDFANAGDLSSAYGWMLFARWADANGCNPVATTLDLADTLRGIASLEAVLSPGQRRAGEMLGASLVAANAAGARALWSCPG